MHMRAVKRFLYAFASFGKQTCKNTSAECIFGENDEKSDGTGGNCFLMRAEDAQGIDLRARM